MLKTSLATTALASLAAFALSAQEAPAPAPPAAENQMAPAESPAAGTEGTVMPEVETAQDPGTTAPGATGEPPAGGLAGGQPPAEEYTEVDVTTLSADDLIGTAIETYDDQDIAKINDVILSAEGQVENVVAEFGGVLGFGANTVLLTMDEIEVLKDPNDNLVVRTNLTPEALQGRPEYEG